MSCFSDLKIYVKQDGMYNSLEIVLSNIPIEDIKDWYSFSNNRKFENFMELLLHIKNTFMVNGEDVDYIRIIDKEIPDEIILTKKNIEEMYPHHFI